MPLIPLISLEPKDLDGLGRGLGLDVGLGLGRLPRVIGPDITKYLHLLLAALSL